MCNPILLCITVMRMQFLHYSNKKIQEKMCLTVKVRDRRNVLARLMNLQYYLTPIKANKKSNYPSEHSHLAN